MDPDLDVILKEAMNFPNYSFAFLILHKLQSVSDFDEWFILCT